MFRRYAGLFRGTGGNRQSWHVRRLCTTTRLNAPVKDETGNKDTIPPKRKRGRPRKDAAVSNSVKATEKVQKDSEPKIELDSSDVKKTKRSRKSTAEPKLPPRIAQPSPNHNDLASFLAYADRVKLNKTSNVYKGTLYEYTVASTLSQLSFTLTRTGRSNDLGIDLVGHFHLPSAQELKVLVQCKAHQPTPSMIRELEGAYAGAPAGWRGDGVLALLVASHPATPGVREALQRSRWPLGLLTVLPEGKVLQFLWNARAEEIGLTGLGVTAKYGWVDREGKVKTTIALTWMGELWKSATHTII